MVAQLVECHRQPVAVVEAPGRPDAGWFYRRYFTLLQASPTPTADPV
jgi:hypothetical protein